MMKYEQINLFPFKTLENQSKPGVNRWHIPQKKTQYGFHVTLILMWYWIFPGQEKDIW